MGLTESDRLTARLVARTYGEGDPDRSLFLEVMDGYIVSWVSGERNEHTVLWFTWHGLEQRWVYEVHVDRRAGPYWWPEDGDQVMGSFE